MPLCSVSAAACLEMVIECGIEKNGLWDARVLSS